MRYHIESLPLLKFLSEYCWQDKIFTVALPRQINHHLTWSGGEMVTFTIDCISTETNNIMLRNLFFFCWVFLQTFTIMHLAFNQKDAWSFFTGTMLFSQRFSCRTGETFCFSESFANPSAPYKENQRHNSTRRIRPPRCLLWAQSNSPTLLRWRNIWRLETTCIRHDYPGKKIKVFLQIRKKSYETYVLK